MEYCPVEYPDQFNQEISPNKAVHIYFSQAIPLVAYIDESCLYLKEKKCLICEGVCQAGAIDLHQEPEKLQLNVGAVILSLGMEPYDPSVKDDYGYGRMQNVVTSMDLRAAFKLHRPLRRRGAARLGPEAPGKRSPGYNAWVPGGSPRATTATARRCAAPTPKSR